MAKVKRRVAYFLFAVAIGVTLLIALNVGQEAICDGWYDLTVEVDADSAANVSSVSYLGVNGTDAADAVVASISDYLEFMKHRDSASPFVVSVGFSYRESALGRRSGYVQEYSHVIVVLHHNDGSMEIHRLEIPDREVSRQIVVTDKNAI